jgi:uncharacterized protein YjbI with pentapeptide repeats
MEAGARGAANGAGLVARKTRWRAGSVVHADRGVGSGDPGTGSRIHGPRGARLVHLVSNASDAGAPRILQSCFPLLFLWILAAGSAAPAEAQATPRVLYEQDFVADSALAALSKDIVLFDLEPSPHGQTRTQFARYDLEAGKHTICLDAGDPFLTEVVLEDGRGKKLVRLHRPHGPDGKGNGRQKPRKPECAQVTLAADTYTIRVAHDGGSIAGAHRVAFAQPMSASPRLADDTGAPLQGYWALRPDPSLDPRRRLGRVITPLPDQSVPGTPFTAIRPLVADFTARQIDDAGLFRFADPNHPTVGTMQPGALNLAKLDASGFWTGFADDGQTRSNAFFQTVPLVVNDLGGYRFELGVARKDNKPADFFLRSTTFSATTFSLNYDQRQPDPEPPAALEVLFRFYPDGTQIGELQEGEVALFQQCNYQGRAAVFALNAANLSELTSPVITLDKTAASVRLGNNTGAVLHSGLLYTGTEQLLDLDTPCLAQTPIGTGNTSSLQILSLASLLVSSRQCERCQLLGVDLSGVDLSGTDADSGVDLKGANLGAATLTGTNLAFASLEGAILDGVTGPGVNLSSAFLTGASLRGVKLHQGKLYGATLIEADLEGADLEGAFLSNCTTAECSPNVASGASLGNAHLKNVNLTGADVSAADFTRASFYSSALVGSGKCTFSDGNCATAAGATMDNTQFGFAYLAGVDFTGAQVQGVQFGHAVLIGANFGGAKLSVDPSVGTNSAFESAFLQGTQLGNATLQGTSLANAFLDFRVGGNDMFLQLSADFASFPNWHAPGQKICVFVTYGVPTTVPTGNTTLTCPNATPAGANGCGPAAGSNPNWNSTFPIGANSTPPASYLQDATYTNAAPQICTPIDTDW